MILVCAVDYFWKYWKNAEKEKHIKIVHQQKIRGLVFFSGRLDGFKITCTSIWKKNCTQNPYFLQKFDFCIFEPKNCEVIEKTSKAPINFSPFKCTYLSENSFQ